MGWNVKLAFHRQGLEPDFARFFSFLQQTFPAQRVMLILLQIFYNSRAFCVHCVLFRNHGVPNASLVASRRITHHTLLFTSFPFIDIPCLHTVCILPQLWYVPVNFELLIKILRANQRNRNDFVFSVIKVVKLFSSSFIMWILSSDSLSVPYL